MTPKIPNGPSDNGYCFLSYAHEDERIVKGDADILRNSGLEVWIDERIQPGSDWPEEIANAISDAKCLVFFASADSIRSVPCLDEVNFALNRTKPVLTVFIDAAVLPPALEFRLGNRQAIFRYENPTAVYEEKLTTAIGDLIRQGQIQADQGVSWPSLQSVSDRPSIAVMPIVDLTQPSQPSGIGEAFTEEITTLLARIPELFVISHASTQGYKDRRPPATQLHRELGIRFVLDGSIREAADILRLDVELSDALTNEEIWSDRFEMRPDQIFQIQDEVAAMVCARLELKVRLVDIQYGQRSGSLAAWRLWQQGWLKLFVEAPAPAPEESLDLFHRALELDPDYSLAHAGIATAVATGVLWGGIGPAELPLANRHAESAFKADPGNPAVLYALTLLSYLGPDDTATSLEFVSSAAEREPSNSMYQCVKGFLLAMCGYADEGVNTCLYGMRLSPKDSREPFMCYMLGNCHIAAGNYAAAISALKRSVRFSQSDWAFLNLAFAQMQSGSETDARATLMKALEFGTRPIKYYEYALQRKLWPQISSSAKEKFLGLCRSVGLN